MGQPSDGAVAVQSSVLTRVGKDRGHVFGKHTPAHAHIHTYTYAYIQQKHTHTHIHTQIHTHAHPQRLSKELSAVRSELGQTLSKHQQTLSESRAQHSTALAEQKEQTLHEYTALQDKLTGAKPAARVRMCVSRARTCARGGFE